ncbi:MAG: IreB family regulatory phosphoprotein [Oscillospiraceae bacterium]|nr:IreB family regulatory phosphoprotein [Oscillospiraceae bacterium]
MNEQTQKISTGDINREVARVILDDVYAALREKGYNPVTQIVGYIMSGDPSYITGHNNARAMIRKIERDELLEELVKSYAEKK